MAGFGSCLIDRQLGGIGEGFQDGKSGLILESSEPDVTAVEIPVVQMEALWESQQGNKR